MGKTKPTLFKTLGIRTCDCDKLSLDIIWSVGQYRFEWLWVYVPGHFLCTLCNIRCCYFHNSNCTVYIHADQQEGYSVDADLYINASCGPVSLKRNEKVRFTFSDDEGSENVSAETAKKIIKAIYKYFSDSTMTVNRLKSGNKEIVAEMSPSQMKDILDTVLPKAVNMNAVMDKGTVSVVLNNGRIDSVSLKVNGVVDVVGTETAASIDFMCSDIRGY